MVLTQLVVVRHAERHDSVQKSWRQSSATPYDTPLSQPSGVQQACDVGKRLASLISPGKIYIHSSPFLRCVQTSAYLGQELGAEQATIRLDSVLGEWLTPDYFTDISPPPPDDHKSLAQSSHSWLATHLNGCSTAKIKQDSAWPLSKFGHCGDYGETWSSMHSRFNQGLAQLISYYNSFPTESQTVILVTHGAGCNAILGYLSNQPLFSEIKIASFAIAESRQDRDQGWELTYNSNASSFDDDGRLPVLSGSSTNTSSSSVSDMYATSTSPKGIVFGGQKRPTPAPGSGQGLGLGPTLITTSPFGNNNSHSDSIPRQDDQLTLSFGNGSQSTLQNSSSSKSTTKNETTFQLFGTRSTNNTSTSSDSSAPNSDTNVLLRFGGNQM